MKFTLEYFIILILLFFLTPDANSQRHAVDSLRHVLKHEPEDTTRVSNLNKLSNDIWRIGNYDTALICATSAFELAIRLADKDGVATAYHNLGNIYEGLGNYTKAMDYSLKSVDLRHETGDKVGECASLNNVALVYADMGNYRKAIEFHTKALNLATSINDQSDIGTNLGNLGIIYDVMHEYPKALDYDMKALAIFEKMNDQDGISINLGNIGLVYMEQGNYKKALEYDFKALGVTRQIEEEYVVASEYESIGEDYSRQKDYKNAITYFDSAVGLAKKIKQKDVIRDTYLSMASMDSAKGDLASEIKNYKQYILYRDTLANEANSKKLLEASMTYEFQQKEDAAKAAQDKKDAEAVQEEKKQILIRNFSLGGLLVVIILAIFIYRGYQQKQVANVIITAQKEEVDKSRKKVMDSIKYAQKIQYSLLPDPAEIKQHVSGYFSCFFPKDIVSGDFYWFHHVGGKSFMAVVDCTGHGVPGACMSMLANSFLNEVIIENGISGPAEILANMHQLVFKTLRQHKGDEYSQDGMDISLLVIDHANNSACFAGAKNSAYIVKNDSIVVLKATPKSVGGLSMTGEVEPVRQFESEKMEITTGMFIVMCTDGIVDQLNKNDEKFGKSRFNFLIQSLYNFNDKDSVQRVEDSISSWKTGVMQQDDMLMVGIRI